MIAVNRRQALALALASAFPARAFAAPQKVTVALDWAVNTNHIGLFVARDKGFYDEAGLQVEILPYGDTAAGTLVSNGIADFGITGTIALLTQKAAGADLKAVYAVTQTETGRLVFNAGRTDIQSPKDLDGLTYGGFGSAWEDALISAIIRNDGGKGAFETVTLGSSAYEALANGSVDFTLEVYTWEGVKAEMEGVRQRAFRYADYGVPDEHTTIIASSDAYLSTNAETTARFAQATRRGYGFAVDHPDEAATLLIKANKDALTDPALIHASLKALVEGHYLRSEAGAIGSFDPAKMEAIGDFLLKSGILRDADGNVVTQRPDFSASFSNAYLASS